MPRALKTGRKNKQPPLPKQFKPGFLAELDGRSLLVKALRERREAIISDLGGEGSMSTLKLTLVDRAIWLEAVITKCESELALAADTAAVSGLISRWVQMVNALQGLVAKLGMERSANDAWSGFDASRAKAASTPSPETNV
jgi:hypothetical protein